MSSGRIKDVFTRVEPLPGVQRRMILDAEFAGDPETRSRVEALLSASDGLAEGAFAPLVEPIDNPPQTKAPERVGPYRVASLLGRGGMACVYRAVQERPIRREVALKVVRPGFDTRAVLSRFDSERQALARLEHRNIATVLDAGADPYGPSWFAMTLVDGPPVTDYCEENALGFRGRLRLFVQICRGVQHAHTRGVLHRDLKPTNILVCREDGEAVPKIIDFGVAKALGADASLGCKKQTLETQIVGTLEYMSPEQARFGNPDVDARSDVYALGIILYEMLTGHVPIGGGEFRGAPLDKIQALIQTKNPDKPSAAPKAELPEDFDCVVLKAIEKVPDDRYDSPKALADDVERYLRGHPLAIRPPTRLYLLRQFARRNRALVAYTTAVTLTVVLGLVGTSIGLIKALDREDRLEAALEREREQEQRLERLAEFQASRLGSTDLDAMALVLRDSLLASARSSAGTESIEDADFVEVARQGIAGHLLGQAVRDAEARFRDDPVLLAAVLQDAAESAAELGLFEFGLPIQEHALSLWIEHAGSEHEDTLQANTNQAVLLAGAGRTDEAAVIAAFTATAARERLGRDHPATISADEVRANMLRRQGDYEAAEVLYRSVMDRWRTVQGATGQRTLRSTVMLATVLTQRGDLEEAEALSRQALMLRQKTLGPGDPRIYLAHHQLGSVLFRLDRREEAEREIRTASAGLTARLGSRHPHSLTAQGSLATLLFARGESREAIEISRTLLSARRSAYGEEHPLTVRDLSSLASMLATQGEHTEAADLAERAYAIEAKRLGPTHPSTLRTANTIGMAAAAEGDHTRAEQYYRLAYEGRAGALGVDHTDTMISLRNLVGQLTMLERYDEASDLADLLMTTAEAALPPEHRHLAIYRMERGRVRALLGSFDGAEKDLVEAHAMLAELLPEDSRFVSLARQSLRDLYELWHAADDEAGHDQTARFWQ